MGSIVGAELVVSNFDGTVGVPTPHDADMAVKITQVKRIMSCFGIMAIEPCGYSIIILL